MTTDGGTSQEVSRCVTGQKKGGSVVMISNIMSTLKSDTLVAFRKRFYFPNDMVVILPGKSDRASSPPSGYISVYEASLRAGLRFPPPPELVDISTACGVALSQFSYRSMMVVIGLIVYFRQRGKKLTLEYLSRLCKFSGDFQDRISCKSNRKWLDLQTKDPPKNWPQAFFFVQNDWNLIEKWGKFSDPPFPIHVGDDDILRILDVPTVENLHYELRHISHYVAEEKLFQVGLSLQAGRSHALPLKRSSKDREVDRLASGGLSKHPRKSQTEKEPPLRKGKELTVSIDNDGEGDRHLFERGSNGSLPTDDGGEFRSLRTHIPEEVLQRICTGRRRVNDLVSRKSLLDKEIDTALNEWNKEFVSLKYLWGECDRKWGSEAREVAALQSQLTECRTELAIMATSLSLQRQEVDRTRDELLEARSESSQKERFAKELEAEKDKLQAEKCALQSEIEVERRAASLQAVEDFKRSLVYQGEIQDRVQEARDRIFDVEVKELERQSLEEGFIRGFLKGVRLVHRKTGASIEGLSPSQASDDSSSDSGDDEIEKIPSDDDEVDILH